MFTTNNFKAKLMRSLSFVIISLSFSITLSAQEKLTFGAGYFGETLFHPGIILQAEHPGSISNNFSITIRADLGYYIHKRNHQALFSEVITGFRWHIGSRFYTGVHGGLGLMSSWHHSDDGVYEVDDNGNVSQVPSYAGIDFMPSIGLEFAYQIKQGDNMSNYIFLRPKGFWQMNVNEKALFHYALEMGYSFSINTKD